MKKIIPLILLLFSCIGFSQIYKYRFNGNGISNESAAFTTRISVASNFSNGTSTSAYTPNRMDIPNSALTLLNSRTTNNTAMQYMPVGNSNRTISFWLKINDTSLPINNIFSYGGPNDTESFGMSIKPGFLQFSFGGTFNNNPEIAFTTVQGVWNFYTLTYDGGSDITKIYVNNVLVLSVTYVLNTVGTNLSIGQGRAGNNTSNNFTIDDFTVSNVVENDANLYDLYRANEGNTPLPNIYSATNLQFAALYDNNKSDSSASGVVPYQTFGTTLGNNQANVSNKALTFALNEAITYKVENYGFTSNRTTPNSLNAIGRTGANLSWTVHAKAKIDQTFWNNLPVNQSARFYTNSTLYMRIRKLTATTATVQFAYAGTTTNPALSYNINTSDATAANYLNIFQWNSYTYTLQNSTVGGVMYINGISRNTSTAFGAINYAPAATGNFVMIGSKDIIGNSFVGQIDDVLVYSAALTQAQVTALNAVSTAPVISAVSALSPAAVSATINYSINAFGTNTVPVIKYGLTASALTQTQSCPDVFGTTALAQQQIISGLTSNTTYYYRVEANSAAGNAIPSQTLSFTTGDIPLISSVSVSSITDSSVNINYTIDPNNAITSLQIIYGYAASQLTFTSNVQGYSGSVPTVGFNILTNLFPNITYFYQVTATSANGTAIPSAVLSFTTLASPTPPIISAVSSTALATTTATINYSINANGSITTPVIKYGLSATTLTQTQACNTVTGTTALAQTQTITGLTPSTTYFYRVEATNLSATATPSSILSFTTLAPQVPVIIFVDSPTVLSTRATIYLDINTNGYDTTPVINYGLSSSALNQTFNCPILLAGTIGGQNHIINGLTPSTTYYYRVQASSIAGSAIPTSIRTFTTSAPSPVPIIQDVQATTPTSTGATISYNIYTYTEDTTPVIKYGFSASALTQTQVCSVVAGSIFGLSIGNSQILSGLASSTTYYYRVEASSVAGNAIPSPTYSFTTLAPPVPAPILTGVTTSLITSNGATINYTLNPNGTQTAVTVYYVLASNPTANPTAVGAPGAIGSTASPYSIPLTGLLPSTQYNYYLAASNGSVVLSGNLSFTTLAPQPVITAISETNITQTSATINYTLNPNGASTNVVVNYGLSATALTNSVNSTTATGTSANPYSVNLPGLSDGVEYFYQIVATGSSPVSSIIRSFTTTTLRPTFNAITISNINMTSANISYQVQPNGSATTAYVIWWTDPNNLLASLPSNSGISTLSTFTKQFINLQPGTTYYYAITGTNSTGTSQSAVFSFTTLTSPLPLPPSISNVNDTNQTANSAQINYNVNANGSNTTTQVFINFGGNPVFLAGPSASGTNDTQLSLVYPGLAPNTSYSYGILATNANGSTFSTCCTYFTTASPSAPVVTGLSTSNNTTTSATINYSVNANGATTNVVINYGFSANALVFSANGPTVTGTILTPFSVNLPGLTPDRLYYYQVVATGVSPVSSNTSVFTTAFSLPPIVSTTQSLCQGATVADLTVSGTNVRWFLTSSGGTPLATTDVLVQGNYYVSHTQQNAVESNRVEVAVTLNAAAIPAFMQIAPVCAGTSIAALPTSSTNGIIGVWTPAINNTATTTYTFTPTSGQCANTAFMTIVVSPVIAPVISNATISNTTANGANINYTLNAGCAATTTVITWGLWSNLVTVLGTINVPGTTTGTTNTPMSTAISTMDPCQSYWVNIRSDNSAGAGGTFNPLRVDTLNSISQPVVSVSSIANNSATLNYSVNTSNDEVTVELYVQQAAVFDFNNSYTTFTLNSNLMNNSVTNYTFPITGLIANSAYSYELNISSNINFCNRTVQVNNAFTTTNASAQSVVPTATAQQTFCSGATVADLDVNGTNPKWYAAATGGSELATTTVLNQGTYYVSQTQAGLSESARINILVTVTTVPAPVAAANQTFCNSTSTLANVVSSATNPKWYLNPTGGAPIAASSGLLTFTYYVTENINSCESPRTAISVTILALPVAPTAAAQSFCTPTTVSGLTASGAAIQWYAAATGGTALSSTTALASGNYYASQTVGTCESSKTAVAVTVGSVNAPTASAQSFCTPTTVSGLTATGTGTIQWYATATGGTALTSTTALSSGNYFASQSVGTCESTRTLVAVTIGSVNAPTAAAQSFCTPTTVNSLTASGTAIQWYAAATGGIALSNTTSLASGNYYASQTVGTCESSRTLVAVTIGSVNAPTASAQSFCTPTTVSGLTASGSAIQWYATATGGTALTSTTALASGNYYASQTVGTCESSRTLVAVTIGSVNAPTAQSQSFCTPTTVSGLSASGTAIKWYAAATGGTALSSTTALASGNYYASQTVGTCESSRTLVAVTIGSVNAPTASAQSFCTPTTVSGLTASGSAIQWYAAATGGTALSSTTALASGNYYASQTVGICESPRTLVAVTVGSVNAPTAAAQSFCTPTTVNSLVASGTAIQWYAAATGGTALTSTTALASGNYYASQTVGTCESTRTLVAVTIGSVNAPTATAQSFCTPTTVSGLTASGAAIQWYAAATGGTALSNTTALASGNYYASQTVGTCESSRTLVAVTIGSVNAPIATAQSFCTPTTVAGLTASGAAIQWYAAATGGTALSNTTALASGNYYASQTVGTCESTRTLVAVTIGSVNAPTATAQSFCTPTTVNSLTASGTAIQWYAVATGGTALSSTTALASGNYYASQTVGTCESSRTLVAVTVGSVNAPTAAAQSFCTPTTVAGLTASGAAIQWYAAATGGTALSSTTSLVTGNYYASQTVGTCESARTLVAVTVGLVNAPTATAQSFCTPTTVSGLTASGTAIQWYAAAAGGTALSSTTALATGNYYASQTVGTCESSRTLVAVTVGLVNAPTGNANQTMATGATIAQLIVNETNITWFDSQSNATANTNALPSTIALVNGATYYAIQTINGCRSASAFAVTVSVTLGLNDSINESKFVIYPNPATDLVQISSKYELKSVVIYSLLGQKILAADNNQINVSGLASGTYMIQVIDENNGTSTQKLIKK